ncbi:MAG: hypothetical protein Q9165_002866 [Trypethelium subeluteriae]
MDEITEPIPRGKNHAIEYIYPATRSTGVADNCGSQVNFSLSSYQSRNIILQQSFHDSPTQVLNQGRPLNEGNMAAKSSTTKRPRFGKIRFSDNEIEKIERDAKRYLVMGYSKFGIPPETAFGEDSSEEPDEEDAEASAARSNDQSSAAAQQQTVRECGFELLDVPGGKYTTQFHGNTYEATKRVCFTWVGQADKTERTECLVAPPDLPIEGVLVGRQFIENVGYSQNLFLEQPASTKDMIMMHKRETETEKRIMQVTRAEADFKAGELASKRQQQILKRGSSSMNGRKTGKLAVLPSISSSRRQSS